MAFFLALGAFLSAWGSTIVFVASVLYQRIRQKKLEKEMDKQKGFDVPVDGSPIYLPVVYGLQKVGGVRTTHKTYSNYKYSDPTNEGELVFKYPENNWKTAENTVEAHTVTDWYRDLGGVVRHVAGVFKGELSKTGKKNEYLLIQQALCFGGISDIIDVEVNSQSWFKGKYDHVLEFNLNGSSSNRTATLNGIADTNKFTNTAYMTGSFKLNRDDYNYQGVPNVSAYVKGSKIWNLVDNNGVVEFGEKEYSNNSALVLLDYMMRPKQLGGVGLAGLTASQWIAGQKPSTDLPIKLGSFLSASIICGTVVENLTNIRGRVNGIPPVDATYDTFNDKEESENGYVAYFRDTGEIWLYNTETNPRWEKLVNTRAVCLYEANITIDTERPFRQNIELLLETMAEAEMTYSEGEYKLILEYPEDQGEQDALIALNLDDNWLVNEDIEVLNTNVADRYNRVTVKFNNEEKDFVRDSVSWPDYGDKNHVLMLAEDNNIENNFDVFLPGTSLKVLALAKAESMCRQSRLYVGDEEEAEGTGGSLSQKVIKLKADRRAMVLETGDLITLNSDFAKIYDETYRIETIKYDRQMNVDISMSQFNYTNLAYSDKNFDIPEPKKYYNNDVANVTNLTYTPLPRVPGIPSSGFITWTAPEDTAVRNYWIYISTTTTNFTPIASTRRLFYDIPPEYSDDDIYIMVKVENTNNRFSSGAFALIDNMLNISAVQNVELEALSESISVKWEVEESSAVKSFKVYWDESLVKPSKAQVETKEFSTIAFNVSTIIPTNFWIEVVGYDGSTVLSGPYQETAIEVDLTAIIDDIEEARTTADSVRADHDALVGSFQGTIDDLLFDYDTAVSAAQDAGAAKDLALGAVSDAEAARDATVSYVAASEAARDVAITARDNAQMAESNADGSAQAAAGSASSASTSATNAGNSATAASASVVAAETHKDDAESAASSAVSSASSAATSKNDAASSASAADTSATTATTKAGEASVSASNAATSESNASGSATTATQQAGLATTAANDAGDSATAASNSASTASSKATQASQSATSATTAKNQAVTAKGQAETAATNAATSEDNAYGSASTATQRATAAANSATTAGQKATAASNSATTASTKANEASQSATVATTAKNQAVTAKGQAESASSSAASSKNSAAGSASTAGQKATAAANSATTAGQKATAAANSATTASTKANEASQSATTATTAKNQANTARTQAQTAKTDAVQAYEDANSAKAIAISAKDTAVAVSSQGVGVFADQFMPSAWSNWNTGPSRPNNQVYPTGKTFTWSVGTQDAGVQVSSTNSGFWKGVTGSRKYRIEIDFELVSGSTSGFGFLFDWVSTAGNYRRTIKITDMVPEPISAGNRYVGSYVVERPSNFSGNFNYHNVYVMINYGSVGAKAAKSVKVHRVQIYPITSTEAEVQQHTTAIADLEGNASAGYLIKAKAGNSVSLLDLVAADGSAGSVSVAKISADNILLDGTVAAKQLAIGDFTNLGGGTDILSVWDGASKGYSVNPDSNAAHPSRLTLSPGKADMYRPSVPVTPGDQFYVSMWVYCIDVVDTGNTKLRFQTEEGFLSAIAVNSAPNRSWTKLEATFTIPNNAKNLDMALWNRMTGGSCLVSQINIFRKNTGDVLVDGSVHANKINTGSFSAAGLALFGGDLRSTNYSNGNAGWIINRNGGAQFNNLIVRNSLVVGSVSDGGAITQYPGGGVNAINISTTWLPLGPWTNDTFWTLGWDFEIRHRAITTYYDSKNGGWRGTETRTRAFAQYNIRQNGSWGPWITHGNPVSSTSRGTWDKHSVTAVLIGNYQNVSTRIWFENDSRNYSSGNEVNWTQNNIRNTAQIGKAIMR